MPVTIMDKTANPVVVPTGGTATPFSAITVSDPTLSGTEGVTVALSGYVTYPSPQNGIGTLTDPTGGGSFNPATNTFTEAGVNTGSPTPATTILNRLVYTPPVLSNGSSANVSANISVNGVGDPTPVQLDTVTPPAISSTIANEPVASGSTIRPFGTVQLNDNNFGYGAKVNATITLTDGAAPTDADGLLTGDGLSKGGAGTYAIGSISTYALQSYLQGLVFTPAAVAAGSTRTTAFELNIADAQAGLSTDDKKTSVLVIGPPPPNQPPPPLIAGTSGNQTVAPGNAISPFNAVTVSDANANPLDSATLTVSGGGTLSGAGLTAGAPPGVFTIAASSPSALTAILNKISFTPPPLGSQTSVTSTIKLDVTDRGQTASDSNTAIKEVAPPPPTPPPPGANFTIADETTGQQTSASGDKYTGPVSGIDQQLLLITPDNLNITAQIPNVFIHSGAGTDALDVSKVNGNNILDGSTGSNFLTGGTGFDTFFLDDRSPNADVFSTIVNFHSGDNASIFGINPHDFMIGMLDNQGAPNAKGLDFAVTAPGHPNANVVLAGYSTADLANGRLTMTYGTTPDLPGIPGSQYLNIHGN